jgi:NAD(P)-dependent dehydrogenase (short-subunit alcohol dehydrogenase family)
MQGEFLPVRMDGKRVLVTAGANGIGAVIARAFLEAGAAVHVCDVDAGAVERFSNAHPAASASLTDVSDPAAVERMFADFLGRHGGIDVLVNNAGIAGPTATVEEVETDALRATLAVDVESMFFCCRHAVPHMKKAGGGSIINLSSIAGRLSFPLRTPYAAAKWGVVGFSKSLALEVGRHGIRVNAVLPGHVNTTRFRSVVERRAKTLDIPVEEMRARYLDKVALGTTVEPQDIANMALFLCSPFGQMISGQAISVCGGVEMMQ